MTNSTTVFEQINLKTEHSSPMMPEAFDFCALTLPLKWNNRRIIITMDEAFDMPPPGF